MATMVLCNWLYIVAILLSTTEACIFFPWLSEIDHCFKPVKHEHSSNKVVFMDKQKEKLPSTLHNYIKIK